MNKPNIFTPRYSTKKTSTVMTIDNFFTKWLPEIDLTPIEQRLDVQKSKNEKKNAGAETKRQGIIGAIFDGLDIGEICVYKLLDVEIKRYEEIYDMDNVLPYAVHDGGHRSRTIRDFKQGKFPTHKSSAIGSKYYTDLTPVERDWFDNYELRFMLYEDSTPAFRGKQFDQAGKTTPLNEQEILNAYGNIPVGNLVRELARELGTGINNDPHPLFSLNAPKDGKVSAVNLSTGPDRLSYDRFVARIVYLALNGEKPNACDDGELTSMYQNSNFDQTTVDTAEKKVKLCLDFIHGVAKAKIKDLGGRSKLNLEEAAALMRLYFTYIQRGSFKPRAVDYDTFWERFYDAWLELSRENESDYAMEILESGQPRWYEFTSQLRKFKTVEQWTNTVTWLEEAGLDYDQLISDKVIPATTKQGPRCFDIEDVKRKWVENGRRDEIDGKRLAFKDAVGAHIVAYSNGGKTEYSNLAVTHRDHNRAMGSMNLVDYKRVYEEQE
jgi:hypothetical protein